MSQRSALHPDDTIQKVLISTTSYFKGEFESENLLISHSWAHPGGYRSKLQYAPGPLSRSHFVVVFRTAQIEPAPGVVVPYYGSAGETLSSLLAVYFGKRFDSHGSLENVGLFQIPDLSTHEQICDPTLPFNSREPRSTSPVPLELGTISQIEHMFHDTDVRVLSACRFYMLALQNAEREAEIAYLHLITAGEILSHIPEYEKSELRSRQLSDDLTAIKNGIMKGDKIARRLDAQMFYTRRRFVKYLASNLCAAFFATPESRFHGTEMGSFSRETIERNVASSYDLRSKYVHSGVSFGKWVSPIFGSIDLHGPGKPVIGDRELENTISSAASIAGLERLIRYHILLEIRRLGVSPHSVADGED